MKKPVTDRPFLMHLNLFAAVRRRAGGAAQAAYKGLTTRLTNERIRRLTNVTAQSGETAG